MTLSISPCHAARNSTTATFVGAPGGGSGRSKTSSSTCWAAVIRNEDSPSVWWSGLIFGARTPISWVRYKFGEAPFKDYWSDDNKNNSREYPSEQARPGTAGGVRPRQGAARGDEAVLGAWL